MDNTIYTADLQLLNSVIESKEWTNEKPLIGVSSHYRDGNSCIENSYIYSIIQAGGVPVLIPVQNDIDTLKELVAKLDGLLLTGGGDINPLYSGEEPLPPLGEVDGARDQYDFILVKLASDRQIPIFGICRGMQVINIAFGGKNYQDIESEFAGKVIKHNQSISREFGSHTVEIDKNSALFEIFKEDTILVNSIHHQAVREVAPYFRATAHSKDGVIEAIEGMPNKRIFGVQWHPEKMVPFPNEQMRKIFNYFVEESKIFKKAKEIHSKSFVLDTHVDTPLKFNKNFDLAKRMDNVKVDIPKMQEGLTDAAFMISYLRQGARDASSSEAATQKFIDILYQIAEQVGRHPSLVALAYTPEELEYLKNNGRKAIFLAVENGYAIGKKIENVKLFKDLGVSYITLCHNSPNDICDSSQGAVEHNGLSEFGKEVVKEMNRLGIMVDISHTSDKTVRDVLAISEYPVIASHSSVRALCNHPRNLSDDLIKEIAAKGGVIQVCFYPQFVSKKPNPTIFTLIEHINYIVQLVGIDHVGIGTDFDGDGSEFIIGCRATNELINLTVELLKQGYTSEDLYKFLGGNLLRVMSVVQAR